MKFTPATPCRAGALGAHASLPIAVCLIAALSLGAAEPAGGTFVGRWRPIAGDPVNVSFSYHREEVGMGTIRVELPSGEYFAGEYLRLSGDRQGSRVERIFARWRSEGFDSFEEGPRGQVWNRSESVIEGFRRKQRDRVVATLISEQRSSMRCSFALAQVSLGLPGGVSGRCQITDGSIIEVSDSRAR